MLIQDTAGVWHATITNGSTRRSLCEEVRYDRSRGAAKPKGKITCDRRHYLAWQQNLAAKRMAIN